MSIFRRRPVPREWREEHHVLHAYSHRSYAAQRGGQHYSRSGGTCSCGETFGLDAGRHNMSASDVRGYWLDHVEDAYYGRPAVEQA